MLNERLKSLALNLERMNVLYVRACDILERERRALIRLDYQELFELFKEKDEVLSAIRALDKERIKVQDLYGALNPAEDGGSISLLKMAERLMISGDADAELGSRLLVLRNTLSETVEKLRHKIDLNRSFIEKSVENLRGVAENVTTLVQGKYSKEAAKSPVYTGRGKFKDATSPTGGLLEKRL